MSERDDNANPIDWAFPPGVDDWASAMRFGAEGAKRQMSEATIAGADSRAMRKQWFDALGATTDAYLRSPPFLQTLKAHVDTLVRARQAAAGAPEAPASPQGQLARDIRSMRRRLKQLDEELQQLKDLSPVDAASRSEASEQSPAPPGSSSNKGATPCEVVFRQGTLRLLRYANDAVTVAEPILICFALVNRPYILDLQDDRSVVRRLLDRGFEVYLIDWGEPGEADRGLRLEDYVCDRLSNVVDFVCASSGVPQLNLLGYCMGGTMSTMFTALDQRRVRNLILMATPIDFAGDLGLLNLWVRKEYFDVDKLVDAFGNCPGEFLQFAFQLMKPVQNFAEKQLTFSENLEDAAYVSNFVALERWANDSIPVAGETFRQYVTTLYQRNQLVNGEMSLAGKPVRLESITCPLLLLVAEKDHLVPPDSTLALKQSVSSEDVRCMSIHAGHIGLAVSSKAHRRLWPEAADWIAEHSTER